MRRVVITGIGLVTPLGNDTKTTWKNITEGKSGVARISKFDTRDFKVKIAAETKGFESKGIEPKEAGRMDEFEKFSLVATSEAVEDSGINLPPNSAVVVGVGFGGMSTVEVGIKMLLEKGPSRVSPYFVPISIANMAAGYISMKYGLKGPCLSTTTACAAGLHAIGQAYHLIKFGMVNVAIAGGTEATITPVGLAAFASMRALSTRNDEPERASRPFDAQRDGFVIGEGAGIVVLEEYELAKKRGAKIYAEVVGFGMSADAYHITAPDPEGEGAYAAMKLALEEAKIPPESILYINAHGTGTKYNDVVETKAIKKLFKDHSEKLWISSTKSEIGHLLGAAGAVETIFTALAVSEGIVPPTINLDEQDPECDLDYVPWESREGRIEYAMCNSFGFGGTNGVIVLRRV